MLLTSAGLEPSLARTMASAAALLSPHSLDLTSSMPLLPKASELKQQNAQTGWRLEASALGNAASGVLPPYVPRSPCDPEAMAWLAELACLLQSKYEELDAQCDRASQIFPTKKIACVSSKDQMCMRVPGVISAW